MGARDLGLCGPVSEEKSPLFKDEAYHSGPGDRRGGAVPSLESVTSLIGIHPCAYRSCPVARNIGKMLGDCGKKGGIV